MKELTNEEFVKQYVPFKELKKAGFFHAEMKSSDYDAITERFLSFFSTTKRQYILNQPIIDLHLHPDFVTGRMPSFVDSNGELNKGAGFKLSF